MTTCAPPVAAGRREQLRRAGRAVAGGRHVAEPATIVGSAAAALSLARVHLDDPEEAGVCPICARRWSEVDGGSGWLHLEVTRGVGDNDLDVIDEDFCSREHAVQWLSRPLPAPAPRMPFRRSWRDRLEDAGVLLLVLVPALFACIGVVATLSWLGLFD